MDNKTNDEPSSPGDKDKTNDKPSSTEDKNKTNDEPSSPGDKDKTNDEPSSPGDKDKTNDEPSSPGDKDKTNDKPSSTEDKNKTNDEPSSPGDKDKTNDEPSSPGDKDKTNDEPSSPGDKDKTNDKPSSTEDKNKTNDEPSSPGDKDKTNDEPSSPGDKDKTNDEPSSPGDKDKTADESSSPGPSGTKELRENTDEEREYTDEDVLENLENVLHHVGDMGRYQIILFLCMLPAGMFFAFLLFVQMFIAVTPKSHWCKVPELAHLDKATRRNLSAPGAASGGDQFDKCSTYDTDWSRVLATMKPPDPSTPTVPCQHGWDFDLVDIPYETVVTERGWVCEHARNVPLAQTLFFVGCFFGGLFFGWMADRYGRVPAFIAANVVGCVGSLATIFTSQFWDFSFCRFVVGLSYDSNFMLIYILLMEYVGIKHRTWVANMSISFFFGGGCVSLPWLALWTADWRRLLWLTALPMLMVLAAPWVVPESARWMVNRGKVDDAVKVFRKFERVNGTKIPQEVLDEFITSCRQTKKTNETFGELLKRRLLRFSMGTMLFVYMTCAIAFDGLVRMSDNLGSDFFITFTLTSATEIPSSTFLALTLDRLGRRFLTAAPLVTSGTLTMTAMFVPKGLGKASIAILSRFFMNMANCVTTQWATELLPTGMRALGSSIMHVAGFLASGLSPFIVFSERVWVYLPLLTLGVAALSSGGASTALPETGGLPMPQTIADCERTVRKRSLCIKRRPGDSESQLKIRPSKHK